MTKTIYILPAVWQIARLNAEHRGLSISAYITWLIRNDTVTRRDKIKQSLKY